MNYDKALKIYFKCYGNENNIDTASSYYNLGALYKDQGNFEVAKTYYEKSLEIYLKCYGNEDNLEIADNYNNLGLLFYE